LTLPGTKLSEGDIAALQFLYPSLNAFGFEVSLPKCFESRITSIWAATENAITMNTETGSFRFDFDKFSTQFVKPARPKKKTCRFNFKTAWVEVVDHQTVYEIIADPGNAEPPRILHSTK